MKILAIDPGNIESAYCFINEETYEPEEFGKVKNERLLNIIYDQLSNSVNYYTMVIEMIASYGMAVGQSVFETCVWIGRFIQALEDNYYNDSLKFIYRKDEKMNLCGSMKAKDSNIRQALIDRFGVVGTKKNPGWFYGFKADIWASYAVGVTYLDKMKGEYHE